MAKECAPISKKFTTRAAADKWLNATHCAAPCVDNGAMLMGVIYVVYDGDLDEDGSVLREHMEWHATRFCKKGKK